MRGGNINPFKFELKPDDLYVPSELVNNNIFLQINDLITPAVTSLENIGKIAKINTELENTTIGGFVYLFRPYVYDSNISDYLLAIMSSHSFIQFMKNITKKSGQAFYNMNKERLKKLFLPLAPYNEQIRIINKFSSFEQLLEQYNKLEKQLTKLENEITDKLKKSILQYAIEGKLVKQDPNDEPASVLLERIKAEKEKLIKEGKIKRDKNESYIYQGDDKNYYEKLPKNWMLVPLSNIITLTSGTDLMPENYSSRNIGVPYLTGASNITNNGEIIINRYTFKNFINSGLNEILITCKGTIGKIAINTIGEVHIARQFMSVKSYINNEFMYFYFYTLVDNLNNNAKSMIPGIDRAQILKQIVLIPPLQEQSRIVSRINILFNIIK